MTHVSYKTPGDRGRRMTINTKLAGSTQWVPGLHSKMLPEKETSKQMKTPILNIKSDCIMNIEEKT